MKVFIRMSVFAASLLILSCSSPKNETADTKEVKLDSLLSQYQEERLKLFPLEATSAGDMRYNHVLPNSLSLAYRLELHDFFTKYRSALLKYDRSALPENDQLSYDVLLWECDIALEGEKFKSHLLPLNQFWSLPLTIGQLASGSSMQPFATVEDYEDWLLRLEAYTAWCDTAIANMRIGIKEGYTLPKSLCEKTIPQYADLAVGPVEEHLFYTPIKNLPASFAVADKERLSAAYKTAITTKIIPIHKKLKEFLETEYLPACRRSSGIDAIPEGKAYYAYLIKLYTTTTSSAEAIFELGKTEVERISKEMLAIKNQLGFKGDLNAFFEHLRSKKELLPFTKPEQVIDNFKAIHERMKPNLNKLFKNSPKTAFEVKRTEAFREKSASAEYNAGSFDGTRPGIFYVPIPDVKTYNVLSDEDLFLHEAIPGHHYQISLQQENTALPEFRRVLGYSAYAEGWALYTESLGKELGLYTDPYQYLGMLSAEMHRSIRLVVDAGMHTQGWTREQAIQYSKEHEAETEASIVAEIERYMAIPGQALSYKIGQLKIKELRAFAEKELGSKFDIAEFHDQLLNAGSLPLKVLEEKILKWVKSVKKDRK
ncbi:MAG: DUF885 domain-containing protein [Bacteroidia bacterium]|jgi:uncharacterized protein (DUF885 family)|nr:DUF885 domain-containing protein [Bacteroidia bacterium]